MPDTKTILCFGDSNTHGSIALVDEDDIRRHRRDERWPGVLRDGLGAGWEVIEEGHPGRTTALDDPIEGAHKNGFSTLPVALETHQPVDLVILMLGTNDLKARFSVTAFDIARATERLLGGIANSACGPGMTAPAVLLVAPVPIEETGFLKDMFAGGATKSLELAGHLERLAERHNLPFVDAAGLATVDPVDGVHLTAQAHRAIGRALAQTVAERFGAGSLGGTNEGGRK